MTGTGAATFDASGTYTIEQSIVTMMRINDWVSAGQP